MLYVIKYLQNWWSEMFCDSLKSFNGLDFSILMQPDISISKTTLKQVWQRLFTDGFKKFSRTSCFSKSLDLNDLTLEF